MTAQAVAASAAASQPTRSELFRPFAFGGATAVALAVSLLAIAHARETRASPLLPPDEWRGLLVVALVGAFVAYLAALLVLRGGRTSIAAVVALAAAIQLAPLVSPLLLSRDAYMYWDYGRIAAIHGGNPHRDFPDQWPNDPAFRRASTAWARERTPYGPGWTVVSELDAEVAGGSASIATFFFRVLAAVSLVAAVAVIAWATRSAFSAALVGWNPVLALHFAGGGHADAAMMALVATGLALAVRRPVASGAAWVAATTVKVATLPFLGLEAAYRLRGRERRWFVGVAGFGVLAVGIATTVFGPSWLRSAGPISNQLRDANSIGLPTRLHEVGLPLHVAQGVCAVGFVLLYLTLLREAWLGRRRLAVAAGGLCLAVAWLMPWYALWPLVLAAFDLDLAGIAIGIALSGYVLLDALPL